MRVLFFPVQGLLDPLDPGTDEWIGHRVAFARCGVILLRPSAGAMMSTGVRRPGPSQATGKNPDSGSAGGPTGPTRGPVGTRAGRGPPARRRAGVGLHRPGGIESRVHGRSTGAAPCYSRVTTASPACLVATKRHSGLPSSSVTTQAWVANVTARMSFPGSIVP